IGSVARRLNFYMEVQGARGRFNYSDFRLALHELSSCRRKQHVVSQNVACRHVDLAVTRPRFCDRQMVFIEAHRGLTSASLRGSRVDDQEASLAPLFIVGLSMNIEGVSLLTIEVIELSKVRVVSAEFLNAYRCSKNHAKGEDVQKRCKRGAVM